MKSKDSALKRIKRVISFYHSRGQNRENVNIVYRNVVTQRL